MSFINNSNNNNNNNNNYIYALYEYFIKHNKQDIDKKKFSFYHFAIISV